MPKPKYKTIYIIIEDARETGLIRGDGCSGTICYSLEEVCTKILKRQWYFNPDMRTWIKDVWKKHGPVKAFHNHTCSAWIYSPTYVKRRIRI